jgi:alpha-amylase/alpha-mannosidase (GH57 family)
MTRVALLWHMHQPFYQDLLTGEHILPWVRLHALKDYYGMVALTREFPRIRMTFNLVPSLLVQLEAFAGDRARDRYLELSLKPAADLTPSDIDFVARNFFHAQQRRMIDVYPRYAEISARRNQTLDVEELRDLQVWHKLAWIDPFYLDADPRIGRLLRKGRGFSEDDKALLREIELEILNRVIPEYHEAAARGQIEISASPFYHPILPLLCDTDVCAQANPAAVRPSRRFSYPQDAAEQLNRAAGCHERLFGRRPQGVWPSEGSVSDAIVPLVAGAGFRWMASDELILARTLGVTFSRDSHGHIEQPERLYVPYVVHVKNAMVACAFRDHVLSDLIGFSYAGWPAAAAADDFVGRLAEGGRRFRARSGGENAFISIILDGENAWEHYEGGGRPFLRALYQRLSEHPELQTVTMGEACGTSRRELSRIHPGSWIDGNFDIWIGHADDRKAWSQLADARAAMDTAGDAPDLQAACEEVLVAEGSDWTWWYGEDHSSDHDLEFDDLFRRHLRNAYRFLGRPVPDELFLSNISRGVPAPLQTEPAALLTPVLDGQETSYFEWLGAGALEIRDAYGTMARGATHAGLDPGAGGPGRKRWTGGRSRILTGIRFGFDGNHLFVRLDSGQPMADLLAGGCEVSLKFLAPPYVRFSIRQEHGSLTWTYWDSGGQRPHWIRRGPGGSIVAAGRILEAALTLADLGVGPGERVAFFVAVHDEASTELERHPDYRPIELTVPDELFEARFWRA